MDVDFFSGENVFTLTTSHDSREVRHAHTHALKKNFFFFLDSRARTTHRPQWEETDAPNGC